MLSGSLPRRPHPLRIKLIKPLLFVACATAFFAIGADSRVGVDFYENMNVADPGAHLLFSGWSRFTDALGLGGGLLAFQATVVLSLSALLLLPQVPLRVTLGGQIALLFVWWVFGDVSAYWHAVEAWGVVVVAMLVATLALAGGRRTTWLVAPLFGVVLGYLPLMRQSAGILVLFPLACCAGCSLLVWAGGSRDAARRVLPSLATFAVVFVLARLLAPWLWSVAQDAPMREHGSGYPLFVSLGFASNPYNIVWDDDFASAQGLLHDGIRWRDNDPAAQAKLLGLWRARMIEDPGMLLRGIGARLVYVIRYFSGTLDPMATLGDGYPLRPSPLTLLLGLVGLGAAGYAAAACARSIRGDMLVLLAGALGLALAVLPPQVVIAPFYLGGAIALCATLPLVFAPAVHSLRAHPSDLTLRVKPALRWVGILTMAALLPLAGYTFHRSRVNRAEARELLGGDPLRQLEALGEHYSFRFNRLPLADQERLLERWVASVDDARVFRPRPGAPAAGGRPFRPVLGIVEDRFVFVVAQLSSSWRMRPPSRVQGPRNSVLLVVKNGDRGPGVLHYLEAPYNYMKIADANWDGRYRMFCLPASPEGADDVRYLGVGAYDFISGDHVRGLGLGLISADRLYRGEASPQ